MNRDQITDTLKSLLRQQDKIKIDVNSIGEETRIDRIGFDSISILDFMYEVENRFNTRMEVADLVRMEVVRDLIDHLQGKLAR
jgi:acyl carrier protein